MSLYDIVFNIIKLYIIEYIPGKTVGIWELGRKHDKRPEKVALKTLIVPHQLIGHDLEIKVINKYIYKRYLNLKMVYHPWPTDSTERYF